MNRLVQIWTLIPAAALMANACAASSSHGGSLANAEIACRASGVDIEGMTHAQVCDLAREAFADHPRAEELTVTLDFQSAYTATGIVAENDGTVLVERQFAIMDRMLNRSALVAFVNELAEAVR